MANTMKKIAWDSVSVVERDATRVYEYSFLNKQLKKCSGSSMWSDAMAKAEAARHGIRMGEPSTKEECTRQIRFHTHH